MPVCLAWHGSENRLRFSRLLSETIRDKSCMLGQARKEMGDLPGVHDGAPIVCRDQEPNRAVWIFLHREAVYGGHGIEGSFDRHRGL